MVVAEEQGVSNVVLKYGIDQAGLDQVKVATDSIQKGLLSLESSAKRLEEAAKRDSDVFKTLAGSSELIGRSNTITQVAQQFAVLGKATGDYESQLKNLRKGLEEFGADAQEIRKATTEFNLMRKEIDDDSKALQQLRQDYIDSADGKKAATGGGAGGLSDVAGLKRAGGALNQLGLGAIGQPLQLLGDVGQVAKQFDKVSGAFDLTAKTTVFGLNGMTVAMGGLAAAGVIFVGGLELIRSAYAHTTEEAKKAVAQLDAYHGAIASGKTSVEITKDIEEATRKRAAAERELATLMNANKGAFEGAQKAYGDLGARVLTGLGQTGLYGDTLKVTNEAIEKQKNIIKDQTALIDGSTLALKEQSSAEADLKAAIAETVATLQQQADVERQLAQDRKIKTSQQAQEQLDQLKSEADIISKQMEALAPSTGVGKDDANKEYERLQNQLSAIIARIQQLNSEIIPGVKVTEDLNEAMKNAFKTVGESVKPVAEVSKAFVKLDDDLAKISEDRLQKLAEIEQSYADKRVDIAAKAVQAAQDNLTKLEQHQEDLFIGLGRDMQKALADEGYKEQDLRVAAARQEVTDKTAHLERLRDIQRSFYESDQQANLDRNFVQLAKNRLAQSGQIDTENSKFKSQEQQRIITLDNQISDERRHLTQQRQQRLVAYSEALQDANRQYTREIQQRNLATAREYAAAKTADDRQIRDTNAHYAQLEAQRRIAYQHELAQLTQHEAQKLKIETHTQELTISSAMAAAQKALAGLSRVGASQEITRRAGGGGLEAFQSSMVNEPNSSGRETFTSGGRTIGLPGFGIFTPLTQGTVNANKGEVPPITTHYNIYGATDPQATVRALEPMVKRVTYETIKQVVG